MDEIDKGWVTRLFNSGVACPSRPPQKSLQFDFSWKKFLGHYRATTYSLLEVERAVVSPVTI